MISKVRFPRRLEFICFLIGLTILINVNLADAYTHLSVNVLDPLAFRNYFLIDRTFGGLLSDFIELADGTYNIEVFGPPGEPQSLEGMFYALRIGVTVLNSMPEVKSVSFDSYCMAKGREVQVKEWPTPAIIKDEKHPNAYSLVIKNPILAERKPSCPPLDVPVMAAYANIGVLKLFATSAPAGAEVWVDGHLTGKTDSTFNVPYRFKDEETRCGH